ncbi:hypothetical protein BOO71_0008848 [Deinococcus marmoris]|uniref:Uncharacterized protein n=1 Tax=Deinococcus marmoris TaxID=249408 RepID=A0A1U7NX04_9DEIO|nr:hypothetical protein BOO71_0008848 [Deinococcus marmoris]
MNTPILPLISVERQRTVTVRVSRPSFKPYVMSRASLNDVCPVSWN